MVRFLLSCTLLFSIQALAGEARLVHPTCKVAIDPTYTNDGLNQIVTQAAKDYMEKKGYSVISMEEARSLNNKIMAIKVDLRTVVNDGKGTCKAVILE